MRREGRYGVRERLGEGWPGGEGVEGWEGVVGGEGVE